VENYTDLEDSEIDLTSSGLKDTVSGSKELRDDVPKSETISSISLRVPLTSPPLRHEG